MSKFAIRLLTPASYAAAKTTTSSSKHIKHKKHWLQRSPVCRSGVARYQAFPVRQARPAQATPEALTVGCGFLHSMSILTEKFRALMVARP